MIGTGDTIFALSSGLPPAAIAIVRVSGPRAASCVVHLTGSLPRPRVAAHRNLLAADGTLMDDAIVLWFPAPATATGEDVAEFHVHGSRAVLGRLLGELGAIDGLRPADPGEFTRRAFENGKIDLTQAEAIDDLIHSDTEAQRRHARQQLDGLLGTRVRTWRQAIIDLQALVEAAIDFADEEDVPQTVGPALEGIERLAAEIMALLRQPGAERLRDGLVVAIAGAPNVGKSTLMNRLAGRDVSIVSPHAGTTRDVIEIACDFGGYPVTLIDTAGLRDSRDPVEQEGIRRARDRAETADLRIWLTDGSGNPGQPGWDGTTWPVRNKADLAAAGPTAAASASISALTGSGIDALRDAVARFAAAQLPVEGAVLLRERHRHLLQAAHSSLEAALRERSLELVAENLRRASLALGRLVGRVDVEDVLGAIFSTFCIGK